MLRRLVSVAVLLAASTGGFMSSRRPAPRHSRRFAAKKPRPGQRGSARAKERLRKALEKEGAPPPRKDPLPTTTTTTSPSRVELRRRAGLPPIEPMLRRAPADLTEKSVAVRGSAKSANSCLRHMNDLASMARRLTPSRGRRHERTRPFPRMRPRRTRSPSRRAGKKFPIVRSRRPTSVPSLQYDSWPSHDEVGPNRDAPRR